MLKQSVNNLNFEKYVGVTGVTDQLPDPTITETSDPTSQRATALLNYTNKYAAGKNSPEFVYNIYGAEGVGKSSFGLLLALSLKPYCPIVRVQLESTVVQADLYNILKPVNDHRTLYFNAGGTQYVRIFPKLVDKDALEQLAQHYSYMFVDGLARLQFKEGRLAERGINLSVLEYGTIELPYYCKGVVSTFTISSDPIRRDIAGTAQGFFEIKSPKVVEVVAPHNRSERIVTTWDNALDVFHGKVDRNFSAMGNIDSYSHIKGSMV